jgi:hypothetical protein
MRQRYFAWMLESHTPVWLLALAAPVILPGWLTGLLLALVIVNVACYLPYVVFNDWWYLRFMLPAIAVLLVMNVAVVDVAVQAVLRSPRRVRTALAVFAVAFGVIFVREARARSVFDLRRLESRYERAGTYVRSHLPPTAMVITSWESGSVRFYGNRRTLVWDVLDPAWLDRALEYCRARGLRPYLLFERWEEPLFRARFAAVRLERSTGRLPLKSAGQVRIYRPEDREKYLGGEGVLTEYAR